MNADKLIFPDLTHHYNNRDVFHPCHSIELDFQEL